MTGRIRHETDAELIDRPAGGLEDAWVGRWRDDMRAGLAGLLGRFEARFGFPPEEHEVAGPVSEEQLAGLAELHGDGLPADLVTFHRVVAEVDLPDVENGYWIHSPPLPGEDPGHPRRLTDGRRVVVFGSDGGGGLFALTAGPGSPVLRLAGGSFLGGAYDADHAAPVAADLQEFLTSLLREVTEAARKGDGH
ncbi:SMI1/KNR4 family protein [Actinoplanes utahensis]|uniref:SMI1/KNR4 family protein n=2 Tax=Actinoplanes utahensis TaxID=1869 RepID=UPI00068FA065